MDRRQQDCIGRDWDRGVLARGFEQRHVLPPMTPHPLGRAREHLGTEVDPDEAAARADRLLQSDEVQPRPATHVKHNAARCRREQLNRPFTVRLPGRRPHVIAASNLPIAPRRQRPTGRATSRPTVKHWIDLAARILARRPRRTKPESRNSRSWLWAGGWTT